MEEQQTLHLPTIVAALTAIVFGTLIVGLVNARTRDKRKNRAAKKSPAAAAAIAPQQQQMASKADDAAVRMLLGRSRSSIADGDKDDALAALLHAIRLTAGEASILGILDEAKKRVDEEFARRDHKADVKNARDALSELLERAQESIIGERGDNDILHDAFVDGSSVVCSKCGSLIKRDRADAHMRRWCPALASDGKDDDDDDDDDDDCK